MPPRDPDELDKLAELIEQALTWIRRIETEPQGRERDRRVAERRVVGFAARRDERDAELNRQRRTYLLSFLRQLPEETLWLWIDGLWLGHATDAQLEALVTSAADSGSFEGLEPPRGSRPFGRASLEPSLPGMLGERAVSVRVEWNNLKEQLDTLKQARRKHHDRTSRNRKRGKRFLDIRTACLKSPIGQRVHQARLFAEFFDRTHLSTGEMAARLLHREIRQHLTAIRNEALAHAMTADSAVRDAADAQAARAAELLKTLPKWATVSDALRQRR